MSNNIRANIAIGYNMYTISFISVHYAIQDINMNNYNRNFYFIIHTIGRGAIRS